MEKYIIVKREKYNEYLIDEAIPEYDIICRKHSEYKFGKQVIITSEPDSVYVAVECKYNEDFDLFVLYIMSLDVFIREYIHISLDEYSELVLKKEELDAIMNEFRILRNHHKNCEDFSSTRCYRYVLELSGEASTIISVMEKYFSRSDRFLITYSEGKDLPDITKIK